MKAYLPVGMMRSAGHPTGICLANEAIRERAVPRRNAGHNSRLPIVSTVARLARQLDSGELSALGRLYDVAAGRLVRYAETLACNPHDAEDALQACMMRIAENPRRLASARHPWAYCLRILRNETLKILAVPKPTRSLDGVFDKWHCDEDRAECEEWKNQVRTTLHRLPPEQMEVVVLKIWEEMTFLEIAEVLGESANTAASRYRYALEKLARYLQPLVEGVCYE